LYKNILNNAWFGALKMKTSKIRLGNDDAKSE